MNSSTLFCCIAAPAVFLLSSCGSDGGKFKDDKKNSTAGMDTTAKYLHNAAATKWEKDWSTENVVVYHWKNEPDNLHPTNGMTNSRNVILEYTQRYLVHTDLEHLTLRPDLVKALPEISANGLEYTYELKDEPTWDDGQQLSVEDVIFTIKAWKCPLTDNAYARPYFDYVKTVVKDPSNPRKFTMYMKKRYIQNVALFGDVPIMERKYHDPQDVLGKYTFEQFDDEAFAKTKHDDLEKWAKEFNDPKYGRDFNYLNGLGAYKVTAWEEKQRIELTKKQNHWTSKLKNPDMYNVAYPDKIIFKVNFDDNSVKLEMKKQSIDASSWVSTQGLIELQKDPDFNRNYHSAFLPNFDYQYIGMNMKPEAVNRPPFFVDKNVRRAVALLVPVEDINKQFLEGKGFRMTSLVSPWKKDIYDNALVPLHYDLEQAKKLLDAAGWKDSDGDNIRDKMIDGKKVQFVCELMISQGPLYENIAKAVAEGLYPAGIKVNVKSLEFVTMAEVLGQHQFDMYLGAWSGPYVAEDYRQVWHSASWANGSNYVGFGNAESDQLIDSLRVTIDPKDRLPMEKRLQELVYDEQPYVFLFSSPRKVVLHKRFGNDDMYYEKPGLYLSNLKLLSPSSMMQSTPVN